MTAPAFLSKSNYITGLRCLKFLWIHLNHPEQIPEHDAVARHRFDEGLRVGQLARTLFPDGIDIPTDNFTGNIRLAQQLMTQRKPLFEAGIHAGDTYSRLDILNPAGHNSWDIIEVKSSTAIKDEYLNDVSFQKYCCDRTGLEINNCHLMYLNNQYVKNGEIDPAQLFKIEEVTDRVNELFPDIENRIKDITEVITAEQCPEVTVGKQCNTGYECSLIEMCRSHLPEGSIFHLYGSKANIDEICRRGITLIRDVPDELLLSDKQYIQKKCALSNQPHIDKIQISNFLDSLQYPCHFLDFETFGTAIPLFDGTKPYQQIPFQFSLHTKMHENMELEHFSFLAENSEDPRAAFLTGLKNSLATMGSIIVYNMPFEKGILKALAEAFPADAEWIEGVCDRMVDLLLPFRNFHYYHSGQKGSASIKKVLPALVGSGYEGMGISEGKEAGIAFMDMIYGNLSDDDKKRIREDLIKYCGLDSEAMALIIDKLRELV